MKNMKKILTFLVLSVVVLLPFGAKAVSNDIAFSCDQPKVCEENGTKNCQSTCTIGIKNNTASVTEVKFTLATKSTDATIKSVTPATGWTNLGDTKSVDLIANAAVTDSTFNLATVIVETTDKATDCTLVLTREDGTIVEKKIETTETVKTGVSLPIAILACGVGAAIVIIAVTKKNNKMSKI